ncbi:maltotransferase domain-containing protein [Demetria terragena]|uniref:maltotransferase domain-containing protein n=1 Tax=Demetria terragena TaxID=63959 RepID=UPI003CCBBE8C
MTEQTRPAHRPATQVDSGAPDPRPLGRIPVQNIKPQVDGGALPIKSVVHEPVEVVATVFREGHDAVSATVVVTDPDGAATHVPMTCTNPGLDRWEATIVADRTGLWSYRVEGWSDPYGTWSHDAPIKVAAEVDTELMLKEGALLLERAAAELELSSTDRDAIAAAATALQANETPSQRLAAGLGDDVQRILANSPLRDLVSPSDVYGWVVERERALTGAWYEFFPRSEGATFDEKTQTWTSGTLRTAMDRLPAIADMGFDVVYLTPIHPIGDTNKKGKNNSLETEPGDPGSPYAIGSADGGYEAIHPELGTWDDFDAFREEAERLGMEVALDLALNCSPDHPWVTSHPEWFTTRADGTIAYAENPPKKYQDIYPLNFDNDPEGLYAAIRADLEVWFSHGVRIIRVDNPHTKPTEFWQWLIADVEESHQGVIWLAEAFTRPAMMHTLGKIGFQQSYTYYAWRNEATELREYCEELAGDASYYMRPSFWPTTHDILTPFMQFGGPTAWKMRAALAATLVPTYGIYSGYELMENVARPGAEEQIDNEKYEFKDRKWADYAPGGAKAGESLAGYLTRLNAIRHTHPALDWMRNLRFHEVDDPTMLCFSKRRVLDDGSEDVIIVVAGCEPHSVRQSWIHLDLAELGLGHDENFVAHDLITDATWHWGAHNYVELGVGAEPVHIIHVRRF